MKIELTPKANEIISKVKSELIGNGKQSVAYVSGMQFALTNPELILAQSKDLYGNKLVEALEMIMQICTNHNIQAMTDYEM